MATRPSPPADGAEAIEILNGGQGKFDLLLTDIQMPVMDGIALALAAARDFSRPDDPLDDRLRRPARTRLGPQRHRPRRHYQAVFRADIRTAVAEALGARKTG